MLLQLQPQNENKAFQKLYFDFNYCKLSELTGYFTIFNNCFIHSLVVFSKLHLNILIRKKTMSFNQKFERKYSKIELFLFKNL